MSTIFCVESSSYLIHSKHVSFEKCFRKLSNKPLTDPWVSKAGRSYLYASRTGGEILKHVGGRLDATQPNDWYLDRAKRFPDQSKCDWLDGWSGQSASFVPEP